MNGFRPCLDRLLLVGFAHSSVSALHLLCTSHRGPNPRSSRSSGLREIEPSLVRCLRDQGLRQPALLGVKPEIAGCCVRTRSSPSLTGNGMLPRPSARPCQSCALCCVSSRQCPSASCLSKSPQLRVRSVGQTCDQLQTVPPSALIDCCCSYRKAFVCSGHWLCPDLLSFWQWLCPLPWTYLHHIPGYVGRPPILRNHCLARRLLIPGVLVSHTSRHSTKHGSCS